MNLLHSAAVASLVFLTGCATSSSSQASSEPAAEAAVAPAAVNTPGESAVGDKTICPVSHEEFVVEADTASFSYEGKTFHVCCADCLGALEEDPEKHLGKYVNP